MKRAVRTQLQAGGDIDLIIGDVIWSAQFAVNGWTLDLSDRIKDSDAFLPGPIEAATYDGKLWAVPWYTDAGLLYFRRDLLEIIRLLGGSQNLVGAAGDGRQPR